jgi:hypothetical protein
MSVADKPATSALKVRLSADVVTELLEPLAESDVKEIDVDRTFATTF